MTDKSSESKNYKYPEFDQKTPYWNAWSKVSRQKLKKHDEMELNLMQIRSLEFKLREAWTPTDKPFTNHD